ncbi:MAG: AIR synthase family protein [Candidatus Bathyarchaeia archaeon]|nr:AIR synthase family protein [Candidatus Bathyarchaeia archaeon]
MKLPPGKIPIDLLREVVFKNLGVKRKEVVLGPAAGFDGSVIDVMDKSLIVSMDPITGAIERIGWLAVNINANDVATFGVEPAFFSSCILLPKNADRKTVETICVQMDKAAKDLGIAIVGGHCEVTPGLTNPIVVGCTMGITEKGNYVTAGGAKPGDKLILTKSAGIEGTAILAADREKKLKKAVDASLIRNARKFFNQISVVKEAVLAFKTGGVNAMHDPTEGGITGGIHEMADASNLGVKIFEEKIRIQPETVKICEFFQIDPLQLIASGSLLIAVKRKFADKVMKVLEKNEIAAAVIGEFLPSTEKRFMIRKDGELESLVRPASDHLWLALENSTDFAG